MGQSHRNSQSFLPHDVRAIAARILREDRVLDQQTIAETDYEDSMAGGTVNTT